MADAININQQKHSWAVQANGARATLPLERYAATAYVAGPAHLSLTTPLDPSALKPLLARSPLGAARIFYWRLAEEQRDACRWVIVSAWDQPGPNYFPIYEGPELVFSPGQGWSLVEQPKVAALIST